MRMGATTLRLRTRLAALAGALLMTAAGLVSTGTPAAAAVTFQIADRAAGQCLDMKSYTIQPGAQVQRFTCNTGTNQHWATVLVSGTSYNLVNEHSGLCIDVRGGSLLAGAEIQQFTCNGTAAQVWIRTPVFVGGALWETLRNRGSNLCIDTAVDTNLIVQHACSTSTDTQLWRFS